MKSLFLSAFILFSFSALAQTQLISGDYGVSLRDRHGNLHHCTLEVLNLEAEETLRLTIQDCPPPVNNVPLYYSPENKSYISDKIYVTTRRGGYKMYEIVPLTSSSLEMISYREYGDGEVGKPRRIQAKLK